MPRGAPSSNRTDLLVNGPSQGPAPGQGQPNGQPVTVPTGLPYGENQQLAQAQQAQPLPQVSSPTQTPHQAARNFQMPALGALDRPTERPSEPLTAGLPGGPLPAGGLPAPQNQTGGISAMLQKMAAATGSGSLSALAQRASAAGQ